MEQPLVSVIIPVYNMERYLERCLDSVLNNTYRNLEVICIDDGSKDSSLEILRRYEAADPRVVEGKRCQHTHRIGQVVGVSVKAARLHKIDVFFHFLIRIKLFICRFFSESQSDSGETKLQGNTRHKNGAEMRFPFIPLFEHGGYLNIFNPFAQRF